MAEPSWTFAIEAKDLQEKSMRIAFPKGISIVLFKKAGKIYALSNKCAHMACPLAAGTLEEYTIKCSCHDWKFDIRTGEFLDAKEIKIPTYESKLADGKIFVKI